MTRKIKILFVCLGNICRSPMAEAVFRHLVAQQGLSDHFEIASAATSRWEVGEPVHPGTRQVLALHGIPVSPAKRAAQITQSDLAYYDFILAMDEENIADLPRLPKVRLLMDFAPQGSPHEVPDPYYNGRFEYAYRLVQAGCEGLLAHIREKEGL
jgi:protein-tyrosine phosphatase